MEAREVLQYPDGRKITFLREGHDDQGEHLIVEHEIYQSGAINGPHWHPDLTEMFRVREGIIRFEVDGVSMVKHAGESITVLPGQVHQFWKVGEERLRMEHEIRPPGQHRRMFELLHYLETTGKLNARGIPRNPLWIGVLWTAIDGYIAGPPKWLQPIVFGSLAALARLCGIKK